MRLVHRILYLILLICLCWSCSKEMQLPQVMIQTTRGDIIVEVDTVRADVTAANFLRYVDEQRFDGAVFYRVVHSGNQPNDKVKIAVIQGGLGDDENARGLPPIRHETTSKTGILHKDGVISMARMQPGSARSEVFICIGDQPELDFGGKRNPDGQGFAAFGRVTEGMSIVRAIQQAPQQNQSLLTSVRWLAVSRFKGIHHWE